MGGKGSIFMVVGDCVVINIFGGGGYGMKGINGYRQLLRYFYLGLDICGILM